MSGGAFDAVLANGMAVIRSASDAAGNSILSLTSKLKNFGNVGEEQFKKIGQAVAKMGGPLGSLGSRFFGAAGLEGGMAKLAVAAVAAGVTFKALSSIMETFEKRAEAFANVAAQLREVDRSARDARSAFASGSEDVGRTQARAESVIGGHAKPLADIIAKEFGLELKDVLTAMGSAGGIPTGQRLSSLRAAGAAASTGEFTMTEALQRLVDRGTRERVLGSSESAVTLFQLMRGAFGPEARAEARDAVSRGSDRGAALRALPGVNEAGNIETRGRSAAFTSRETEAAKRAESAAAINPKATAMLKWFNALQESQQKQRDLIDATPAFIQAWNEITSPVNNAEVNANREMVQANRALLGTGGTD